MEKDFVENVEAAKPIGEKTEQEVSKLDEVRGSPLMVGNLEEFIDENHVIVSTAHSSEYYVSLLSIVDQNQLEPGSTVLLHNKNMA